MEETKLQHLNSFTVVGRLIKADIKQGTSAKTGQSFVSVKATVQSVIGGVNNEFDISFYANQMTGGGKPSSLYASYCKMSELEGKKVEIQGSLRENRYFSSNLNQIISAQELAGRFIKGVAESAQDDAKWEMSGFVAKTLVEKVNKKEEIYRYDLTLAQANYNGSAISMFVLHVDPSRKDIIRGVEGYEVGQTVRLNGALNFKVETVTAEAKNEGGFGEPVIRTFTNRTKNFFITGGSAPINDETKYQGSDISDLISNYKAHDVELSDRAKSAAPVAAETTPKITKKQTSLI